MKKIYILLLGSLLILLTSNALADKRFNCDTYDLQNAEPLIEDMLDRILVAGKIKQQFHICRLPHSYNAAAIVIDNKRIIAYDPAFLNGLSNIAGEQHWGKIIALAHEVGHHIYNHNAKLKNQRHQPKHKWLALRRQYELQADQFAGNVLAGMGASLDNTKALIRQLKLHRSEAVSAHPDAPKRVHAVTQGWNMGCKQAGKSCNSARYKHAQESGFSMQSPLGRNATPGYQAFMQQAESLKGIAVNRAYCNRYAALAVQQTKRSSNSHCGYNVSINGKANNQWSTNYAPQSNWCMTASAYATSNEAKFRETRLASFMH